MKFQHAWAKLAQENLLYKWATGLALIGLIIVGFSLTVVSSKTVIVIDRGCFSSLARLGSSSPTAVELRSFVETALSQRFDSGVTPSTSYLSLDELRAREKEEKELRARNMTTKVLLNEVKRVGDLVEVNADRIISVKEIRSAFRFPLVLTVGETPRTEANPYGLVLIRSEPKPTPQNGAGR